MEHILNFGKHRGESVSKVRASDPLYLTWLANVGVRKDNSLRTHDQYTAIQTKDPLAIPIARALVSSNGNNNNNPR